jgi:hypothetical protein
MQSERAKIASELDTSENKRKGSISFLREADHFGTERDDNTACA